MPIISELLIVIDGSVLSWPSWLLWLWCSCTFLKIYNQNSLTWALPCGLWLLSPSPLWHPIIHLTVSGWWTRLARTSFTRLEVRQICLTSLIMSAEQIVVAIIVSLLKRISCDASGPESVFPSCQVTWCIFSLSEIIMVKLLKYYYWTLNTSVNGCNKQSINGF